MMRRIILMSACVLLVAGACSDSAETSSTSVADSSANAPPTTTAPATTTTVAPTTTTEPAPTTTETPPTTEATTMRLTSPAFENEDAIPERFTCDSDDISPALALANVPADAISLVLIVEDPDAPNGTWDHWIAYDIRVVLEIIEDVGDLGTSGANSWGQTGYGGPCPPSGTHRYFFTIYASDTDLGLDSGATKAEVLDSLEGHVLAEATLMGTYGR